MRRTAVVAALVLATLIGGGAALIIRAQSDSGAAELRLSARRMADGSVELGLQRWVGEDWAARILPDGRFLPPDAALDQWFDSASFALNEVEVEAGGSAGGAPAEPAAQASESGEQDSAEVDADGAGAEEPEQAEQTGGEEESAAEDAVEEGAAEESASDEVAADDAAGADDADEAAQPPASVVSPADRIIDALAGVRLVRAPPPARETYRIARGDTLSSIAASFGVTLADLLELNELTPTTLLHPDQTLLIPHPTEEPAAEPGGGAGYAPIEAAPGVAAEAIVYGTIRDQSSGVVHSAALTGAGSDSQLAVACADGRLAVFVLAPSGWLDSAGGDSPTLSVYYQLDGGPLRGDRWEIEGARIAASDAARLVSELEGRERLSLRVDEGSGTLRAEFAIAGLLGTPIQANFNNCGG